MFYVYLIQNDFTKEIYIGFSRDIKQRLKTHNEHGNKSTSRKNGLWKLVYTEIFRSEKDAKMRERRLKEHGSGKNELLKRLKNSLLDT